MIDKEDITRIVEEELGRARRNADGGKSYAEPSERGGLFLVEVKVSAGDEVEVFIDSDAVDEDGRIKGVSVEDCVALTKAIEARMDREAADFSLTVSSAGIGQPLRVERQYRKLVGQSVEVVMKSGSKMVAVLEGFDGMSITLSYVEKRRAEGKKRPEMASVEKTLPLDEVKSVKEHLEFK